jgi:hypothetical protein
MDKNLSNKISLYGEVAGIFEKEGKLFECCCFR